MKAAQAQAAGAASGAADAAKIRAEDQSFNSQARAGYQTLIDQRLINNYQNQTEANAARFGMDFGRRANRASIANSMASASQRIRTALLSALE
jgi:hypothetical protein